MHSVRVDGCIIEASPCSSLPAPMLNLHRLSPMPLGFPASSQSVEKSQSAIFLCSASGHRPTYFMLHASEAPKCSTVCRGLSVCIV